MHDQGSWVRDMFEGLDDPAKSKVVHEIGLFSLAIIVEGSVVQAERDGNNNPLDTEAPPVMPADLLQIAKPDVRQDILDRFRGHIKKHWSEENIDTIEDDHKELVHAAKNDDVIKKILEGHDEKVFCNDAWDAITLKKADGTIRFAKCASVLWRARDRLPEQVRGVISLLRRQIRKRQPTHRSRIVVFGWDHAFKAVLFTLQALLSIPAAPLHV
jgi:hypothetical protein